MFPAVSEPGPVPMDIDSEPKPKPKQKKKTIPKSMRVAVWNTYIGEDIGRTKCGVCGVADITQMNFHCAHVIAESKGGPTSLANLRPTCAACNLSMRTMNLNEYKEQYFPFISKHSPINTKITPRTCV